MTHGNIKEAARIVGSIEESVLLTGRLESIPKPEWSITIVPHRQTGFRDIARTIIRTYPQRSILAFSLMVSQAFFYNAIFFTYALVLTRFYNVLPDRVGLYLLPFALGNFLGPLLIGRLFDTIGRKPMISLTYALSAFMLAVTGYLFTRGVLNAATQTIAWTLIFFIASSAASSAYLTVSEIFPIETRAMAIAVFYALGTGVGGVGAPALFGFLIQTGTRENLFYGYLLGAGMMLTAALTEMVLGVKAERKSLEEIAEPLSSEEASRR